MMFHIVQRIGNAWKPLNWTVHHRDGSETPETFESKHTGRTTLLNMLAGYRQKGYRYRLRDFRVCRV